HRGTNVTFHILLDGNGALIFPEVLLSVHVDGATNLRSNGNFSAFTTEERKGSLGLVIKVDEPDILLEFVGLIYSGDNCPVTSGVSYTGGEFRKRTLISDSFVKGSGSTFHTFTALGFRHKNFGSITTVSSFCYDHFRSVEWIFWSATGDKF